MLLGGGENQIFIFAPEAEARGQSDFFTAGILFSQFEYFFEMLLSQVALAATDKGETEANKFDLHGLGLIQEGLQIECDFVFACLGNLRPELGGEILDFVMEALCGGGQLVQGFEDGSGAIFSASAG